LPPEAVLRYLNSMEFGEPSAHTHVLASCRRMSC
jgi:hypothetical protein